MKDTDLAGSVVRFRGEKGIVLGVSRPGLPPGPAVATIQIPGQLFGGPPTRVIEVLESDWDELEILEGEIEASNP